MKVLLNNNHTPHAYMMATALRDISFVSPGWNGEFRELPGNVSVVPFPKCLDFDYNAVIDDNPSLPTYQAKAGKKIWLQHCEYLGDYLPPIIDKSDRVVVVSDHRRATMKEWGLNDKVVTIPPGFDVNEWPISQTTDGVVGTSFNAMNWNDEVREFVETIAKASRRKLMVIGHHNDKVAHCQIVSPYGLEAYKKEMSKLSVWVYCVVGEVLGMAAMEAMAMGIPVVMGSYPEAWNFCFNNWNCFITRSAPADSVPWISESINRVLADMELRQQIGMNGRKTIEAFYPATLFAKRWLDVLQ